jgi:uncharacterized RDD family membrane protein YckC
MDWHYAESGQQIGPVSEERLLELAHAGSIKPDTLVWHAGMAEWKSFREAGPGIPPPLQNGSGTRFCSSCGRAFAAGDLAMFGESAICMDCKPAWIQRLRQGMTTTAATNFTYAGFWIRLAAVLIDGLVLGSVGSVLFFILFRDTFATIISQAARGADPTQSGALFGAFAASMGMFQLVSILLQVAYLSFMWFRFGATLGQLALGLKVVRPDGSPISLGTAIGRAFARFLSWLILGIGYMMAGWDDEKRALHDRLAGTRVIRVR